MTHSPPEHSPVVVGAGRLTFDAVVRCGEGVEVIGGQAGGTCGNVLASLAYLGWQAYPLADLGVDDPGGRIVRDLARCGVHLDLIGRSAGLETPVVVHRIEPTPAGPTHSFTSRCPFCDWQLPDYEPVPGEKVVARLPRVPVAQAIFFDRDSAGALLLARHGRANGALVVYEPNYAGPEVDLDAALAVAHVVKVSADVLSGFADTLPAGPSLVIETRGTDGLRVRDRRAGSSPWHHLPALPVAVTRDAAGAGDACTAGFLDRIARHGAAEFFAASVEDLRAALRFGQAVAAWSCAFEGARGGMAAVSQERFRADVARLLAGACFDPGAAAGTSTLAAAGAFCPRCGGRETLARSSGPGRS